MKASVMTLDEALAQGDIVWFRDGSGATAFITRTGYHPNRGAILYRTRMTAADGRGTGGVNFDLDQLRDALARMNIPEDVGWQVRRS